MTELDINGTLLEDTENSVVVNMTSASQVDINNVVVWSRVADLPVQITDFVATNDLRYFIACTWTEEAETLSTDLYVDGLGIVATGVTSPYNWIPPERVVEYNIGIISNGDEGSVLSNQEVGMLAQLNGSVTLDYNGYSAYGTGYDATVIVSNGNGTFIPPTGVSAVNICMCGGGGSGKGNIQFLDSNGGGWAGTVVTTENAAVDPEVATTFTLGLGGPTPASNAAGINGGDSRFDSVYATGGGGGDYVYNGGYSGNQAAQSSCGGNGNDGGKYTGGVGTMYGGESNGFANGGWGHSSVGAGVGCGGGAAQSGQGADQSGGNGRIVISW
ncbi:MAG: hypothetical protein DRP58_03225 [Spirochaetes bacterium]|nr:MAG: hypothetical protein DRP58_03225 [Spirochaetota bacterium]